MKINSQITVDVFCVDYLKPSYVNDIKRKNKLRLLLATTKLNWDEKRFLMRVFKKGESRLKYLLVVGVYIIHLLRMILTEKGIERLMYKMAVDPTNKSKYMGIVIGSRQPVYFSSDFILNRTEFDGIEVFIPSNYDEILKRIYGDYMTLPPENERFRLDKYEIVLEVN